MSTQRVYSAIDGTELKEIILQELRKQMEEDTDFRQHIAYPQVRFTFRLDIEVYGEGHEQTYEKADRPHHHQDRQGFQKAVDAGAG
jgi:hypothetical protein